MAEAFRGDKWPKKGFFPNAYTVLDPGPENGLVIEFNSSKHVKAGTGETKIVSNVFKASGE